MPGRFQTGNRVFNLFPCSESAGHRSAVFSGTERENLENGGA